MKKRLYRSKEQRMIGGVLGGIGEYFDVDPTIIRLGYIFIAIFSMGVPAVLAYILALIVIPEKPDQTVVYAPPASSEAYNTGADKEGSAQ